MYRSKDVALGVGYHDFIIEWYEGGGEAWISFDYGATSVECTQDSHCTADSNKAKCSLTTNTCVDSVAPTSKITKVEDLPGIAPGFAPNTPFTDDYSAFLKGDNNGDTEKTWSIYVEDTDNSGGSGIDSCFISVNGLVLPRVCNGWAFFSVGKPATGAHCNQEGINTCRIKVWAQDRAVNKSDALGLEREIGRNPTTLSVPPSGSGDERKYKDFATGFNVWSLGVDWTAPTAQ